MNLIADRLFALLLGWTRSLFNSLWNLVTNDTGGFIGVLQRIWLPLVLLMLLFGTVVDYIIWLIRWRPYYAWSAWLRKRLEHRRLNRTQHYMEDLDHSPLDLPEYQYAQDDAQPVLDEPVYFDFQGPWQQEEQQEAFIPAMTPDVNPVGIEPPPQFVPSLPWENLRQVPIVQPTALNPWGERAYEDLPPVDEPAVLPFMPDAPLYPDEREEPAPAQHALAQGDEPALRRRRRVDSKRQRAGNVFQSLKSTFFTSEEDNGPVDALQPPISQEEAFHKPYIPQNYAYREQTKQPAPQDKPPQ